MHDPLLRFLITLATDPDAYAAFMDDPRTSMADAGLSRADQDLLIDGTTEALYHRIVGGAGTEPPVYPPPVYPNPVYPPPVYPNPVYPPPAYPTSTSGYGGWPCPPPCCPPPAPPPCYSSGMQGYSSSPTPVYPPPVYPPPVYPPPVYPPPVYPPPVYSKGDGEDGGESE